METLPIRNRRLLVIDERQADRDRVCGLLQGTLGAESPPVAPERGYQVDTAGSAEEALGRIRSALQADAPYAVVFLGMPSVGADIPVLERFWRLDSRLQVVVHAPPADFPLLAPWAAEERLLLLGLPLQGQEVRQMAGNLSAKWNVTAHLQLQMSRMEAAIQEITREVGQAKEALEKEIGERKELESQLVQTEKLASIGHLAAGVAHEINNPISYVSSNYTTLEEHVRRLLEVLEAYEEARPAIRDEALARRLEQLGERVELAFVKEDVAVLLRESREGIGRVRKIVQDLKNFSRVDAEDDWQWTDLHQGIESTLNIVASELKYRADVVREYGDLPEVKCLPSQINQVVMNLVMNAAQAMGPERGRIVIRTGIPWSMPGSRWKTRAGHLPRDPAAHLRSVLHHQAGRQGDRPGVVALLRHRPETRRHHRGTQPAGSRQRFPDRASLGIARQPGRSPRKLTVAPARVT